MLKTVLFSSLFLLLHGLQAQQRTAWAPDAATSQVSFQIKNFGVYVDGSFKGISGSILWNADRPLETSVNVSVDASTINTGINARDNHLRKAEYFNVAAHPKLSFVSTRVVNSTRTGTYIIYGQLSIKKTTREISFPFTVTPHTNGFTFEGNFQLNRRDYGIGSNSLSLSDIVKVELQVNVQ